MKPDFPFRFLEGKGVVTRAGEAVVWAASSSEGRPMMAIDLGLWMAAVEEWKAARQELDRLQEEVRELREIRALLTD